MSLVMQLLADGIPPSLLCDLADPEAMIADLQAELAEIEAVQALCDLAEMPALSGLAVLSSADRRTA